MPVDPRARMLNAMRALLLFALTSSLAFAQPSPAPPAFEVASVRPSQHIVGPDYNNQFAYTPNGISARNVTLKRLVAEAYHLQINQVFGPGWLDQSEYDIDARAAAGVPQQQKALMLRALLSDRFKLSAHSETREMRVYELVLSKSGPKIHPVKDGEAAVAQEGFHFHGDMRQFADLLAVQLTIPAAFNPAEPVQASASPTPVLDKTGLPGIFDFSVDIHPELGTDMFTPGRGLSKTNWV